jgi:transposase-like protein
MTSSKVAIADKQEILRLYCESDLSTAELSKQFGISISSTLRLLQEMMSPEEYREAVQKKQAKPKRQTKAVKKVVKPEIVQLDAQLDLVGQLDLELQPVSPENKGTENEATESQTTESESVENQDTENQGRENEMFRVIANETNSTLLDSLDSALDSKKLEKSPAPLSEPLEVEPLQVDDIDSYKSEEFEQYNPEDGSDDLAMDLVGDLVGDGILDIEDDDEFDDDDEEEEDDEDGSSTVNDSLDSVIDPVIGKRAVNKILVILPLEQAELSNICYMVVDKASEMVTRPMQDFKELGKVPSDEVNLLALPVFDNHRAARRFSAHNQKVIKFPSSLIHAAKSHLSQKGITRLLYGGQVFAL